MEECAEYVTGGESLNMSHSPSATPPLEDIQLNSEAYHRPKSHSVIPEGLLNKVWKWQNDKPLMDWREDTLRFHLHYIVHRRQ
jgi:hypothetical protein